MQIAAHALLDAAALSALTLVGVCTAGFVAGLSIARQQREAQRLPAQLVSGIGGVLFKLSDPRR